MRTADRLLDTAPEIEPIEHRLDLGREELCEVMERYAPGAPRAVETDSSIRRATARLRRPWVHSGGPRR